MTERCVEVTVYDNEWWDVSSQGWKDAMLANCRREGSFTVVIGGTEIARLTLCEEHQ